VVGHEKKSGLTKKMSKVEKGWTKKKKKGQKWKIVEKGEKKE
jgi:hypothetical protein